MTSVYAFFSLCAARILYILFSEANKKQPVPVMSKQEFRNNFLAAYINSEPKKRKRR